jgi:hypothetical protein
LFNAYQTDLPRRVDFVDEVERWKFRWNVVNDRPERRLDTLHTTSRDLYPAIYSIVSILLTIPVSSATSGRSFSAMRGRASKKNFARRNKTAFGPGGQAETSLKIEDMSTNKTTCNEMMAFLVTL